MHDLTAIFQSASLPERNGLRFLQIIRALELHFGSHPPPAETIQQTLAHMAAWPASSRPANRRWWMHIQDVDPIGDWDNGERFQGWKIPPDWQMQLAASATLKASDPKLQGEVLHGLLTHPALSHLSELRIQQTLGPEFTEAIITSHAFDHLKLLDLEVTGLSKPQLKALQDWRKRTGVLGETKGFKHT